VKAARVKIRENVLHQWIIVQAGNEQLAWSASRWVPLNEEGLAAGDLKPLNFKTVQGASAYAASQGFEVQAS
jgi:hypothetical protein